MDVARSAAHVFRTPANVSRHSTYGTTTWDGKTAVGSTRLTSPVLIGDSTTGSPSRTGNQDIISTRVSIGNQWIWDAQPLDTSINGIYSEHRDPAPIFGKVIGRKITDESSADVNLRCRTPSSPKVQTSLIWGYRPSTHRMNSGLYSSSLP